MKLALSVRIAEGFLSKEIPILTLSQVIDIAQTGGYQQLCMRASQIGIASPSDVVDKSIELLQEASMPVSMVTGNFDIVYNNEQGPDGLRNITPFLDLADRLGSSLIRVALKQPDDIAAAQSAADEAADRSIRLVHQCHTLSLFETIDGIESTLRAIGRPNFGLIFEPANLEICGQPYGRKVIERLADSIFNVYFQNQVLKEDGAVTLDTWCRGPVAFDIIQIHESGGIDFQEVITGLRQIGYDGTYTVHQCAPEGMTPYDSAAATANFLRDLHSAA